MYVLLSFCVSCSRITTKFKKCKLFIGIRDWLRKLNTIEFFSHIFRRSIVFDWFVHFPLLLIVDESPIGWKFWEVKHSALKKFPKVIIETNLILREYSRIWRSTFCLEIKLREYEKEQLENWEFQGAEYFIHMKRAEEKNTLERRVCTLGDKYVLCTLLFSFGLQIGKFKLFSKNTLIW